MGFKPRPYRKVRVDRPELSFVVVYPRGYRGVATYTCCFRYFERDDMYGHLPKYQGPPLFVGETIYATIYWSER